MIQSATRLYIVTEFAPLELRSFLDAHEGPLKTEEQVGILSQLVAAVSFLHSQMVCHRDLKPENILLGHDVVARGSLKLIDFGLSCKGKRGEKLRRECGSPGYMAPELMLGEGYDGSQADSFSVGVVMFEVCLCPGHGTRSPAVSIIDELAHWQDFSRDRKDQGADFAGNTMKAAKAFVDAPAFENVPSTVRDMVAGLLEARPSERASVQQFTRHPYVWEEGVEGGG